MFVGEMDKEKQVYREMLKNGNNNKSWDELVLTANKLVQECIDDIKKVWYMEQIYKKCSVCDDCEDSRRFRWNVKCVKCGDDVYLCQKCENDCGFDRVEEYMCFFCSFDKSVLINNMEKK